MVTHLAADQADRAEAADLPETADPGTAEPQADSPVEPAAPAAVTSHRRALTLFALVAAVAVVLDVVTKQLVVAHLTEGNPVKLLGGAIYLSLIRNGGAAFSMGTHYTFVFPLITLVVIGWIVWMAVKLRSLPWAVSLGLVLGGALGNLGDRLFRTPGPLEGHVVDFISILSPYGRYFAVFNVADSALTCGVVLAVLLELTGRRRDGARVRN